MSHPSSSPRRRTTVVTQMAVISLSVIALFGAGQDACIYYGGTNGSGVGGGAGGAGGAGGGAGGSFCQEYGCGGGTGGVAGTVGTTVTATGTGGTGVMLPDGGGVGGA